MPLISHWGGPRHGDIDDVPASVFATDAPHEDRLALKELGKAMTRLPTDQREALVMVVVHGMSYEALAEATGCAVGTAKSRVFRARRQLEAWLIGDVGELYSSTCVSAGSMAWPPSSLAVCGPSFWPTYSSSPSHKSVVSVYPKT